MSFLTKFSGTLYHARNQSSYTQEQVAEAISVTVRWYQRIEKGERIPGTMALLRLILFLQIDVEEFREEVGLIVPLSSHARKTGGSRNRSI